MKIKSLFILLFDSAFWKTIKELIFILYVKKFRKVYKDINELPIYNFSKILNGDFGYLYIRKHSRKYPKLYFQKHFQELVFQLRHLDNTYLRMVADSIDYYSKYVRTGKKRWLNEFNTIKKKLDNYESKNFDLNDFVSYIEKTYNYVPGSINPKKLNTAYAFKIYREAIDLNMKRNSENSNKLLQKV